MDFPTAVLTTDQTFFASLLAGAVDALDELLAPDFVLIDVLRGAEIPKPALLAALAGQAVRFETIEPTGRRARLYGDTAVVTGRTLMKMRFGEESAEVRSRYTHVYVRQDGGWRFVSAQGTPIVE
jgi:ketosteroid isomerase-like protein